MPVTAEPSVDLQALPRFQRAAWHARLLQRLLLGATLLGMLLVALTWPPASMPRSMLRPWLISNIAMLLLLGCGLQAAYWVARWRVRVAAAPSTQALINTSPATEPVRNSWRKRWLGRVVRLGNYFAQLNQRYGSPEGMAALLMGLLSLLVLLMLVKNWQSPLPVLPPGNTTRIAAAALLLWSFILLVVERYFTGNALHELPEARQLALLFRIAISVAVLSSGSIFLSDVASPWPARLSLWLQVLPALLAIELLLRALLSVFTPRNVQQEPAMLADSLFAGLWRWPPRPWHYLHAEFQQRFGIDLRQSWAFAYIRRALLPVLSIMLVVAWLLSGVSEVAVDSRAIYERLGKPVAVLQPGLHLGLPWPFARLRKVENGVVHELATASASDANTEPNTEQDAAIMNLASAEGAPPLSANRLWDASHVAEKSQVIASQSSNTTGNRQSFQVVNMDVRFMYRIGLADADALAATYNANDVPQLIRSTANRILVSYFASRTLEGVLGEQRLQLASDIGVQVQRELKALHSGVEILATVIEAIHPPAAAANAYHSVQAAQISAQAIIARERGSASEQVNLAQLRASMARNKADATARETLATAEVTQLRFAAERNAYQAAGKAFLLEQYLAQLSQGLSTAQLVVVDHRLRNVSASIDLRSFSTAADAARKLE